MMNLIVVTWKHITEPADECSCCTLQALAECAKMRPPVDISVGGDDSTEGVGAGKARTEFSSSRS